MPILGICLGGQLIARTLGALVHANHTKEIGWYDVHPASHAEQDPLIGEFNETEKIFQWHGDTFEIPHSAVHLASSRACSNQAFRYQTNVYAFQFHLEVDEPMILRWLKVPENRREIQSLHGDIDPDQIHRERFITSIDSTNSAIMCSGSLLPCLAPTRAGAGLVEVSSPPGCARSVDLRRVSTLYVRA